MNAFNPQHPPHFLLMRDFLQNPLESQREAKVRRVKKDTGLLWASLR